VELYAEGGDAEEDDNDVAAKADKMILKYQ